MLRQALLISAAIGALAAPATAASFAPGPAAPQGPVVLGSNFDPVNSGLPFGVGSSVFFYTGINNPSGLQYSSATDVFIDYEFVGFEAGYTNNIEALLPSVPAGVLFTNKDALGTSDTVRLAAGTNILVPFQFNITNTGDTAENGNLPPADPADEVSIGWFIQSANVVYALLNDGGNSSDQDYDDMIVKMTIREVPIPPAALLFGTALAGVGFMSRRKKAQSAA